MEDQGTRPPAPPLSAPQDAPPPPAPSDAGVGSQPPMSSGPPPASYGYPPSTAAAPPPRKSGRGWKIAAGIAVVLVLLFASCCGALVFFMPTAGVPLGDAVAVIYLDGVIAGIGGAGYITPEGMRDQLEQALSDPSVKAIVVRVDSPGGTVAASQEISIEVSRAAEVKPIVASVGDVGASGAYMVMSQCDEIWALPTSAVGSIGVIAEIPNVKGLMDKLGVEFTVVTAGKYKDVGNPFRSMTETETQLIQGQVDIAYEQFIEIVAEGRGIEEDEVREMATGWAWSALEAQEMGLVDELGTFSDALDAAAELGGIDGDYEIVYYDDYQFEELLGSFLGVMRDLGPLDALESPDGGFGPAIPK